MGGAAGALPSPALAPALVSGGGARPCQWRGGATPWSQEKGSAWLEFSWLVEPLCGVGVSWLDEHTKHFPVSGRRRRGCEKQGETCTYFHKDVAVLTFSRTSLPARCRQARGDHPELCDAGAWTRPNGLSLRSCAAWRDAFLRLVLTGNRGSDHQDASHLSSWTCSESFTPRDDCSKC